MNYIEFQKRLGLFTVFSLAGIRQADPEFSMCKNCTIMVERFMARRYKNPPVFLYVIPKKSAGM